MTETNRSGEELRPKSNLPTPTEWMNTDETADHLGLKPKTLVNMRSLGTGPVYHKIGAKVWYRGKWSAPLRWSTGFVSPAVST